MNLKWERGLIILWKKPMLVGCRMSDYKGEEWVIHQVYVDETQDFTQAELSLLISCCQNPNDMFLTGKPES